MVIDRKYEISLRVRQLRKERGYTKDQLAEMADISVGFLGDIECGKKGVGADTLARLATALRVTSDYLLYGAKANDYSLGQLIAAISQQEQQYVKSLFIEAIRILDHLKYN